jgi:hypothetical protein
VGGSSGTGGAGGTPSDVDITWAGTWSVRTRYAVDCDLAGNVRRGNQDFTATTRLTGANSDLVADTMGYRMAGSGDKTKLTLSGQYPIRDDTGEVSSNVMRDNNVTFRVTTVLDAKNASGTLEATFVGRFGKRCTVRGGSVVLSR